MPGAVAARRSDGDPTRGGGRRHDRARPCACSSSSTPTWPTCPCDPSTTGWDNVLLRLGDRLAVRIPRRASAAALVEHEQRWLPLLAPRLRVPVPVPVRVGRPSATLPVAVERRPVVRRPHRGRPPAAARRHRPAVPLADVRRPPARPGARRTRRSTRSAACRCATGTPPSASGSRPGGARRRTAVAALWDRALAAPAWAGPPLWLHGDLHPANLLARRRPAGLAAVLDFGDLTAGDPATDLATAWLTFDATGRAAFREHVAHTHQRGTRRLRPARTWRPGAARAGGRSSWPRRCSRTPTTTRSSRRSAGTRSPRSWPADAAPGRHRPDGLPRPTGGRAAAPAASSHRAREIAACTVRSRVHGANSAGRVGAGRGGAGWGGSGRPVTTRSRRVVAGHGWLPPGHDPVTRTAPVGPGTRALPTVDTCAASGSSWPCSP